MSDSKSLAIIEATLAANPQGVPKSKIARALFSAGRPHTPRGIDMAIDRLDKLRRITIVYRIFPTNSDMTEDWYYLPGPRRAGVSPTGPDAEPAAQHPGRQTIGIIHE